MDAAVVVDTRDPHIDNMLYLKLRTCDVSLRPPSLVGLLRWEYYFQDEKRDGVDIQSIIWMAIWGIQ